MVDFSISDALLPLARRVTKGLMMDNVFNREFADIWLAARPTISEEFANLLRGHGASDPEGLCTMVSIHSVLMDADRLCHVDLWNDPEEDEEGYVIRHTRTELGLCAEQAIHVLAPLVAWADTNVKFGFEHPTVDEGFFGGACVDWFSLGLSSASFRFALVN